MSRRALLPLLPLIALLGCPRWPRRPPPPPAPGGMEAQLDNGFISVHIDLPPTPARPAPAVISLLGEREALLDAGLAVVTYRINWELLKGLAPAADAAPKNTVGVWLLASPSARVIGKAYFELIAANAATVSKVLDHLATVPEIDLGRVGIAGASTNGFVTLQAVAADQRLGAAVAIAACGDYHRFLHLSTLALKGEPLDLDPAYEGWLHGQEPVRHAARMTHAALMMVNGTDDAAIPLPCVRETVRVLKATYRHARVSERFRSVLIEHVGHDLVERSHPELLAWMRRWLAAPSPASESDGR